MLVRGAGRRDAVRFCAMTLGVGLAVFASLFGFAAPRVSALSHQVEVDRAPVFSDQAASGGGLHWRSSSAAVGDRPWTRVSVGGATPTAPLPPGIRAWPHDGVTIPSPALRRLATEDRQLAAQLGTLTPEDILPAGLTEPDELMSYTVGKGAATGASAPGGETDSAERVVVGFGNASAVESNGPGLLVIIEVGLLILTPAVIFLVAALRFSASSRSRRSFALGLAGMAPSRNAKVYASEMSVVAIVGFVAAALAFNASQAAVGSSGILGVRWWPNQGHLGWPLLLASGIVAVWTVRAVARRAMAASAAKSRSQLGRAPGRLLLVIAVLVGAPSMGFLVEICIRGWLQPSTGWASDGQAALIAIAVVAATGAVIVGAPGLVARIGDAAAGRVPGSYALGLRGAAFRIPVTRRMIAFVATTVMLTGLASAFLVSLQHSALGDPSRATIVFGLDQITAHPDWLNHLPDGAFTIESSLPGDRGNYAVVVGNCPAVERQAAVVFTQPGTCLDTIQRGAGGTGGASVSSVQVGSRAVPIPAGPVTSHVTWDLKFPLHDAPWVGLLRTGEVTYWVSRSDGSYQAALGALTSQFPGISLQAGLKDPGQYAAYQRQVGTVRAAMLLGMLLSLFSFLLGSLEGRWERARSVAALAAIGVPRNAMRRANMVEFAFPVLAAAIPATAVGVLGGWAVVSFHGTHGMFSTQVLWWTLVGAVASAVIAAGAGWVTGSASFNREVIADT